MFVFLALLSLLGSGPLPPASGFSASCSPIHQNVAVAFAGPWEELGGSGYLFFDQKRCVAHSQGRQVLYLMDWKIGEVRRRLAYDGGEMEGRLFLEGQQLVLEATSWSEERRFQRIEEVPECLRIDAYTFGTRVPSKDELEDLRFELDLRSKDDQEVRQRFGALQAKAQAAGQLDTPEKEREFQEGPEMQALAEEMREIDGDNTERLVELVQDIGWISKDRFGSASNLAAFLIVQHSGDLRLMRAALPIIEREAKGDPQLGQHFALLWDRTQLMLGEEQRYGSQLGPAPDGGLCIRRLENPAKVDERRAEMGMGSLEDYMDNFRGGGVKVRVCEDAK